MDLKLDPSIRPEFLTYSAKFNGGELGNETEVWVCKTSDSFGLSQGGDDDDCDIILLDKEGLLHLQRLVNQAIAILEKE